MVAINFPDSPTNGQEHEGYVWDATNNVWNRLPTLPALDLIKFSAVAPSNPQDGQFWFDTTVGKMYVYYNDGSSSQWVSAIGGLASQQGTEGQLLVHDGSEWIPTDGVSHNLLYNGAMQVAQRGTSETGLGSGDSGYHTADRWNFTTNSGNTAEFTQTVESDGPTGSGFTKSLKMECTTANASPGAGDVVYMTQRLEGQDLQGLKKGTSSAESLTLSFWVKSNVTGTYIASLYDTDNSRQISQSYTVSSSGTWEKKTITFVGDTSGAFDNDSNGSLWCTFALMAGTDYTGGTLPTAWQSFLLADWFVGQTNLAASTGNYFQITGVQLEAGTVATPFEHKPYGVELAECQRYYWADSSTALQWGFQVNVNATTRRGRVQFPSPMRAAPTMTFTSTSGLTPSAENVTEYGTGFVISVGDTTTVHGLNSLKADAEL